MSDLSGIFCFTKMIFFATSHVTHDSCEYTKCHKLGIGYHQRTQTFSCIWCAHRLQSRSPPLCFYSKFWAFVWVSGTYQNAWFDAYNSRSCSLILPPKETVAFSNKVKKIAHKIPGALKIKVIDSHMLDFLNLNFRLR